ncbi:integrase, catalytic region, zinc finger, CCHC-type containing protein, partial [Tanacetum coccineum]
MRMLNSYLAEKMQAREQEELANEEKARLESSKKDEAEMAQESSSKRAVISDKEGIAIDAILLSTKPPSIVDYKIIKEGKISIYQIIRADGSSKRRSSVEGRNCWIKRLHEILEFTAAQLVPLYKVPLASSELMRAGTKYDASSPLMCSCQKPQRLRPWLCIGVCLLNFGAINHLARHGLVRGLPRLKFEKDHLCSACAMGKSKKQSHKPKSKDTNQEKLYLLHMDLCGPMRVASVNRKKVHPRHYGLLLSVHMAVRNIRIDNGTEFVNQTLRDYYEQVGISHETSVARTSQQNGVVERQNRTLVKAARTMLIYAKAPLFLWAKAVATLTAMASKQSSLEPALHEMTPVTPSSSLVPNPYPSAPFVPPSRHEWDFVFQPMFDELFSPPASIASPVPVEEAPAPVESTDSPSSTTIDQNAPSPSTSQTTLQSQSQTIPLCAKEELHYLEVAHMSNDPYFGIPILET